MHRRKKKKQYFLPHKRCIFVFNRRQLWLFCMETVFETLKIETNKVRCFMLKEESIEKKEKQQSEQRTTHCRLSYCVQLEIGQSEQHCICKARTKLCIKQHVRSRAFAFIITVVFIITSDESTTPMLQYVSTNNFFSVTCSFWEMKFAIVSVVKIDECFEILIHNESNTQYNENNDDHQLNQPVNYLVKAMRARFWIPIQMYARDARE